MIDTQQVAERWLAGLAKALSSADVTGFSALFTNNGYFRDLLTFSWDFRTLHGQKKIQDYFATYVSPAKISNVTVDYSVGLAPTMTELKPGSPLIFLAFKFETELARGRGSARLVPASEGEDAEWKALCAVMMVSDWKGHEETSHETGLGAELPWVRSEAERKTFIEQDPYVLIVGGGQAGLQMAARCKQMCIKTLVVERNAKLGDEWRNRYPTLKVHSPRLHHTFLYQPFPSNWPTYTPKDKLADWIDQYATTHDLVVWTSTEFLPGATYDEASRRWKVTVNRGETLVKLNPAHIIVATSIFGDRYTPVIAGQQIFQGEQIHSSAFPSGELYASKRILVVGACNSAADICHDLVRNGAASVTMLQRSATCVVSEKLVSIRMGMAFPEGVPVEISDFKNAGFPLNMFREMMREAQPWAEEFDRELHVGLKKAGMKLTAGLDGSGQLFLDRGGGFLIDFGVGDMIADGRISIKQGITIDHLTRTGVNLSDGTTLDVDCIIYATGWGPVHQPLVKLFGEQVINQCSEIWGTDDEGELRGVFRPSGHPALWFAAGDFATCRAYSKQLSLLIRAHELGLME